MLKYAGSLIAVEDMAASRNFYEQLLGQKVKYDFGQNVAFEGDFSIHLKSHFQTLLGDAVRFPVMDSAKKNVGELYFESDDIESVFRNLKKARVEFIHEIQEQPWGQRVMRLYDPDGFIVEIGESMEAVVRRFYDQGFSVEQVSAKSSMPLEFVKQVIQTDKPAD
jgi:catechol 2,3-dioxygenase-like lactoylglutathione lyase family enzyme